MIRGYRLKNLFLKMSYEELEATCKREGWKIPMTTELQGYDIQHDLIWTASTVLDTQYKLTEEDMKYKVKLGIGYSHEDNREHVINKNFKIHCSVLVKDTGGYLGMPKPKMKMNIQPEESLCKRCFIKPSIGRYCNDCKVILKEK